jgi:hypothetical protein
MASDEPDAAGPVHDLALLLLGPKRNEVLTLEEVQRHGRDSFGLERASFDEAAALLDRAKFQKYGLGAPGRNHGLLVGVRGWAERPPAGRPTV